MLKGYVDFEPETVYDPTAGQGNLLSVFGDDVKKFGQELFADELEKANQRLKNFTGYVGDTLKDDGFPALKFDLIVANPPFSIKWEPNPDDIRWQGAPALPPPSKADYAFILHILHHLSDKGKAICLEFPGILYRGNKEGVIRRWLVEKNYIERVVHVPGNTFVDTQIATCILVLNKSKNTTDIVFEDREQGIEKTVSLEEVAQNDYTLAVSTYTYIEPEKEEIDPVVLDNTIRRSYLDSLKTVLEMEQMVCQLEGWDTFGKFLDAIEIVVKRFRRAIPKSTKATEHTEQMNLFLD